MNYFIELDYLVLSVLGVERKLSSTRMRHTILNPALYHPKAATAPIGFRIPRLLLCSQSKYNLSELWHDSLCGILLFHQTANEYYIASAISTIYVPILNISKSP
jgi:hypothetical protein